jgi:hypothetical protein
LPTGSRIHVKADGEVGGKGEERWGVGSAPASDTTPTPAAVQAIATDVNAVGKVWPSWSSQRHCARAAATGITAAYAPNDAENAPMLAVNTWLGYQITAAERSYQKTLRAHNLRDPGRLFSVLSPARNGPLWFVKPSPRRDEAASFAWVASLCVTQSPHGIANRDYSVSRIIRHIDTVYVD